MVSADGKTIDFEQLEKQLQNEIDGETLYYQQNSAKFRAVEQGVPSYEDFRQMVLAAHLRPLDKNDKMQVKPKSVWNTFASRRKQVSNGGNCDVTNINTSKGNLNDNFKIPLTLTEFTQQWRKNYVTDSERYSYLRRIGSDRIRWLFGSTELGFGLLGEIIRALLRNHSGNNDNSASNNEDDDLVFAVRLLEVLPNARRFGLTLQFQSTQERSDCNLLFVHLQKELRKDPQDLAERGVTEWTIQELAKKYEVDI